MCTRVEITRRTLVTTASFFDGDPKLLNENHKLQDDVGFDHHGLVYLADGLRAHVGQCDGHSSIYVTPLRRSGFTVGNLVKSMIAAIKQRAPSDTEVSNLIARAKVSLP